MPWDSSANCGFTTGEPWLPLGADHAARSVEAQKHTPGSMLALTRALLDLRRREPALALGNWAEVEVEGDVLAYARTVGAQRFVVVLNLEAVPKSVRFGERLSGRVVLSTHPERAGRSVAGRIDLAGDEAVIIAVGRGAD